MRSRRTLLKAVSCFAVGFGLCIGILGSGSTMTVLAEESGETSIGEAIVYEEQIDSGVESADVIESGVILDEAETVDASYKNVSATYDFSTAYQILDIVNQERVAAGLSPLTMDKDLLEAAMFRGVEISECFDHTRPNGLSCFSICDKSYGENIAYGYSGASTVMAAWMKSAGHKANILGSSYTTIGIGAVVVGGTKQYVQIFGYGTATPVASKPSNQTVSVNIPLTSDSTTVFPAISYETQVAVTGITISNTSVTLNMDGISRVELKAKVEPTNATNTVVNWSTSDKSIAVVNNSGEVTGKSAGKARITATTADGGYSASCTIYVYDTYDTPSAPIVESKTSSSVTLKAVSGCKYSKDGTNWQDSNVFSGLNANTKYTFYVKKAANGYYKESPVSAGATVTTDKSTTGESGSTTFVAPEIDVYYRTHIQNVGWEGTESNIKTWKKDGVMSGTSGRALRLEGINIVVTPETACPELDLGIQYTTHCQDYGWLPWSADGEMNGTEGESKRLEAIEIQLTGAHKDLYDVYYRVHAQDFGWLGWAKNGEPSGTAAKAKRLEGIQIQVVKKGTTPNWNAGGIVSDYSLAFYAAAGSSPVVNYPNTSNQNPVIPGTDVPNVVYKTHVQNDGWQRWRYNGQMSGTSGRALRLEGIRINLSNKPCDGGIEYKTHVQNIGWQDWVSDGVMSGTSGRSLRLEAICIELTGDMANQYDVYYRVHAQDYGWLGWAKNGASAGTAGYSKRLEGIQIVLVKKGGSAPANNYGGIVANDSRCYIENN